MPDPIVNPAEGDPPKDQTVVLNAEEYEKLKNRLAVVEDKTKTPAAPTNPTPPATPPPSLDDQLKPLNDQITALNTEINQRLTDQKPLDDLMSKRDTLVEKRMSLRFEHEHLNPLRQAGVQSMSQIASQIAKKDLRFYDLLKDKIEATLATLPKEQLSLPDTYKQVHDFVAGQNMDLILEKQREEILRKAQEEPSGITPTGTSRQHPANEDPDAPPPIEQLYSESTIRMLKQNGRSIDDHYRSLGYESYADWWKKTGKEFHGKE